MSPEPVAPQMTYPPSQAGEAFFSTSFMFMLSSIAIPSCGSSRVSRNSRYMRWFSRSRAYPSCSRSTMESEYMRGCWPFFTIDLKISSTLVMLKLPHIIRFLDLQLLRLRNGCTYDMPLFPVVEYLRWPMYISPTKGVSASTSQAGMESMPSLSSWGITEAKISVMALEPSARSRKTYSCPGTEWSFTTPIPAPSWPRLCCFSISR